MTIVRNILEPLEFKRVAKETIEKPKRQRILIPEVIVWLRMLASLKYSSMANTLSKFWEAIRLNFADMPLKTVNPAVFCNVRSKLPIEFFCKLFEVLRGHFIERFPVILE